MEFIRLQGNFQAVILGLVIWAVFLGTMMYIEGVAASSLLGLVTRTVKSGYAAFGPSRPPERAPGIGRARELGEDRRGSGRRRAKELFPKARRRRARTGPGIKEKRSGGTSATT